MPVFQNWFFARDFHNASVETSFLFFKTDGVFEVVITIVGVLEKVLVESSSSM